MFRFILKSLKEFAYTLGQKALTWKNTRELLVFVAGAVIWAAVSGFFANIITRSVTILIVVVVIHTLAGMFLFNNARSCIQDLSDNIEASVRNRTYMSQEDMYRDLIKIIDEKGVRTADLIQYSSVMATDLLSKLASKGATITLYIHTKGDSVSEQQKSRIENAIEQLPGVLMKTQGYKLTVREYRAPASIRAVRIDDDLLAIG